LSLTENQERHEKLTKDLAHMLPHFRSRNNKLIKWDALSIFEDGTEEFGYVIALLNHNNKRDGTEEDGDLKRLRIMIRELAIKYDQGAIYEYEYISSNGTLMRKTVPVLDADSEAIVEVFLAVEKKGS